MGGRGSFLWVMSSNSSRVHLFVSELLVALGLFMDSTTCLAFPGSVSHWKGTPVVMVCESEEDEEQDKGVAVGAPIRLMGEELGRRCDLKKKWSDRPRSDGSRDNILATNSGLYSKRLV